MAVQRFKRYRMEIDFRSVSLPPAVLPDGFRWLSWQTMLGERHAQVKWRSFRGDLDGRVFKSLSDIDGCRRLITEIRRHEGFCPASTWLVAFHPEPTWPPHDCGTIQGIRRNGSIGSIQNVGVIPEHRGQGIGRAIVLKALEGFQQMGLDYASLEVTAINRPAVSLYQSLGFHVTRILYREVETDVAVQSPAAAH
ncbi:MAG: GNAT family N-acetyltransferase [Planctomycetaceae bacterium]|nr:GNAT family N-acetyltransferase [Planctomycetaceae bacterium]